MRLLTLLLIIAASCTNCSSQSPSSSPTSQPSVGGPCEGCEAIYEYGERQLTAVDTLPGFQDNDPKIILTGTVYQPDGKTPAAGTILYIYHTDREGLYSGGDDSSTWSQRHGRYRGWVKTDAQGHYTFYTFRPAAYPGGQEEEHIHLTVKPTDTNEYYLDSFVFADDPLLTKERRARLENRGGSGIIQLAKRESFLESKRDIVLGLNIPGY